MEASSVAELRTALEALEAQLREGAEWLEKQETPDDESPYRVFGPKRSALVLDAFRDALNVGAFADDEVMQDERARAFPGDIPPKQRPRKASKKSVPVEVRMVGRTIGCWIGYQPLGNPQSMFIERLLRGWLRLFDFGKPRSQNDVVDLPPFRVLTVKLYACGLRCLARAVRVEIERQCPPTLPAPSESNTVMLPLELRDKVLRYATTSMRGIQRRVVTVLCECNSPVPMRNLAHEEGIGWNAPYKQQWDSAKKGIDRKLYPMFGLKLTADGGNAAFQECPRPSPIKSSSRRKRS